MGDNVVTTGGTIRTIDVGGVQRQVVSLDLGGEGASQPVVGAIPVSQPGLSGGIHQSVTTVGVTAVPVPATPLAGRATMLVGNVGATTIYLGSSTVTADTSSTGSVPLLPGQSVPISLSSALLLYAISSAAGGLVGIIEVAA